VVCPKPLIEQWREYIKLWDDKGIMWEVIGKEQFRINYKNIQSYDGIIIDEVHRQGGNYKSKFFKALMSYKKRYGIKKVWLLSGTPFSNNSFSVYSLGLLLGRDWSWWDWRNRYFYMIRMGMRQVPVQKTGIEKSTQTSNDGLYYLTSLRPSVYDLTATLDGFGSASF